MRSSARPSALGVNPPPSNTALLAYEFKVALKRNKATVLRLFEKGRQVQPTDHVIRTVAPFTLRSPVVSKEVALLGDILDPNRTGFVTLKRIRELVTTHDDTSEGETGGMGETEDEERESHQLVVAKTSSRQRFVGASGGKRALSDNQRWVPPKRSPPGGNSNNSLYAVSTALSLVPQARDTSDPDMLAIMTAIQWSGKHLAQPNTIERRLIASTPLSRYAVPVSSSTIPSARDGVDFSMLSDALKRVGSDEERGWCTAALIATHVRSEVVFRELIQSEVPEILVPEDVLQAFLAMPRWYRMHVLDSARPGSSSAGSPHEMFRALSAVRLPLVVTALRVEMDSATRKVMNAFLPLDLGVCWARSSEKERSALVTALLDLGLWEDDFVFSLGGAGMEGILLTRSLMALPPSGSASEPSVQRGGMKFSGQGDEAIVREGLAHLARLLEQVSAKASEPIRVNPSTPESLNEIVLTNEDADDQLVVQLKEKIALLTEEILL